MTRLNLDGSKQVKGIHYNSSYAPVVIWPSIRLMIIMVLINNRHNRQIDYVMAYPKAPVERDMYMTIPNGHKVKGGDPGEEYTFQDKKNIYGPVQVGSMWNLFITKKLKKIGLHQSEWDPYVFWRENLIYILYIDDVLIAGPDEGKINKVIQQIKDSGLNITEKEPLITLWASISSKPEKEPSFYYTTPSSSQS